jgi:hypothetical protein
MNTTQIDDGGPAFHSITVKNGDNYNAPVHVYHRGMSLRDWFAGQALAGLVFHNDYGAISDQDIAKGAYSFADAMIAARKEKALDPLDGAAGSAPSGTWLAITEHLPHVGDVIACRAPNTDGGLIYWAGKVIEVRPPHAVMEMRGAYTRQFVITHDTEWVSLPNSQLNQPELG